MSLSVKLPALGESVVEGTVARWLVKEGDRIERDQPLVEITTEKVDTEIPAPEAGVIEKILVPEGETVEVGTELVRIASAGAAGAGARRAPQASEVTGEAGAAGAGARRAPQASEVTGEAGAAGAGARRAPQASEVPAAEPAAAASDVRATPVARLAAAETGVDLHDVEGTGAGGRVTKGDVRRHAARGEAPPPAQTRPAATAPGRPAYLTYQLQTGDRVIPMSPLRKLVAQHMVLSKQVSPHVGTVAEIDMGGIVRVREVHKRAFREQHGFNLTYLPFVVHATVRALREFPRLNASVVEDSIVEKKDVHIGIAVETEKGLVVPVVRHADRLSLTGLSETIEDLSNRARSKQLSLDELKGGTFTVSNPGRQGNLYGFAIINQPQVGILRMGEMVKRPVVRTVEGEDAIVVRPMMHLALSYDHRAVDGAPANAFLFRVRELLEEAEFDL